MRAVARKIMSFLRDQAWGGVVGIITVMTLCGGLLVTPRFEPARAGIAVALSGATATATIALVTPTPTIVPPTATATSNPSTPAGFDTLPTYNADTTLTPNWQFDCGGCDQIFLVTVTQITINYAAQNMVWTLSLFNHTADNVSDPYFSSLRLTDPKEDNYSASGAAMQGDGKIVGAGQTIQRQATFAYLPKHDGVYTLKAYLHYGGFSGYSYGPQQLTFP